MIDTPRLTRILIEVVLGIRPKRPDTAEEKRIRSKLREEVGAIRKAGGIVEIPT